MRTLKKTLSLVLVVAMVLGLCVVGASAYNKVEDFTDDVAKIGDAYYEAVGVLTGIQVIDGMTETSFQPQGNYTREQAAKIIAYMMLGKADADSLRCTKAPFDDVAADRWSAGYIAFCVEQGIIDGMTETTFEPTGTLTGFQWAKMLLCAVGFGVKGEFTGSSWSLNTAKYAHNVDLFAGDLAGADHTAITREQAALYAFNVLTAVDLVVYSESLGDYIKGYNSWFVDRYTPQGTLGETAFGLGNVVGVIVNNEGMGNATTNVNVKGEYNDYAPNTVSVKADTGLDLMYHAARVWYVAGKTNTGVFTYDLAKVETTNCPAKATDGALKIGDTTKSLYESVAVDNTAIDAGKKTVEFYASWEMIGAISSVNKTTVLGGYGPVKDEYITFDAEVESGDYVIVLKASDKAYYTFELSASSGAVQSVNKNGVITLTDGTVIAPSNIAITGRAAEYAELLRILVGTAHITPTYYFTLDTHGHYMSLTQTPFQTVAYFTGVTKLSSAHDAWSNSVQFAAQFVDVQTGEIETIPVHNDWVDRFTDYSLTTTRDGQGYFDITDELYGDPTYSPHPVLGTNGTAATYSDKFVNIRNYTFSAADSTCILETLNGRSIRFNPSTVTFIIANNAGDSLTVDKYTGVSGLIEGYALKHNQKVTSVSLSNMAVTYSTTAAGNPDAVIIFAFDSTIANGQYVFFPYDVTSWDIIADNYYGYDVAYLDGKEAASDMVFTRAYYNANLTGGIARGFYTYTIDEFGFYTITRVANANQNFIYKASDIDEASGIYWINGHRVADDVVIADTRANVPDELKVRNVANLYDLIYETNWAKPDVQIAYMLEGNAVGVIYVVDWNLGQAAFSFSDALDGWTVNGTFEAGVVYEDEILKITGEGVSALADGTLVDFGYTFNGAAADKPATGVVKSDVAGNKWVEISAHAFAGWGNKTCTFVITSATYNVTITNMATKFDVYYKYPSDGGVDKNVALVDNTGKVTIAVGSDIKLCFERTNVANNTVATVDLTGAADQTVSFGSNQAWTNAFVPVTNELVIESVTAVYDFVLDEATAVDYFGLLSVDGYNKVEDVVLVPGDTIDLVIKYSQTSDLLKTAGFNFPNFKLGADTKYKSTQAASTVAESGQPLNFVYEDVLPGAVAPQTDGTNVVTVTFAGWFSDTGVEWTGT